MARVDASARPSRTMTRCATSRMWARTASCSPAVEAITCGASGLGIAEPLAYDGGAHDGDRVDDEDDRGRTSGQEVLIRLAHERPPRRDGEPAPDARREAGGDVLDHGDPHEPATMATTWLRTRLPVAAP